MKVLRIIARLNVGGPARHVIWLNQGLTDRGYESVLVTGVVPPGEDDMNYVATDAGLTPFVLPQMSRELSPKDLVTTWKLFRLMRRERPDIVHTHTAKAGAVGRAAGLMYRWFTPRTHCHFVHTYHGHIFHGYFGPVKTRLFLTIERLLARLVTDRLIVLSEQQLQEINEAFRVGRREQFRVIPLGIELDRFGSWRKRRDILRTELGATEDEILVGIVGRLTPIKNHRMFLQAAAIYKTISRNKPRVRFLIIGDGRLRRDLEESATALGLNNDVVFLGTRDDPENFYPGVDIVALTSFNEGTPLTLIEAMANERPVIATAVGGVVDLLGSPDGEGRQPGGFVICERGVSVRSGDAETLAQGLKHLIEGHDLRTELGRRGREFVRRRHAKERLLEDMASLYAELGHDAKTAAMPESPVGSPTLKEG